LLKGLLTPILNENVNYINAPVVAKERGIKVVESKSSEAQDYTSMIAVTVKTSQDTSYAAGTIFGRNDLRIVRVNKFTVEVIPEGHMLVVSNYDKPGVIGNLGTTLGANNLNIGRLHLSREQVDKEALVVLTTDTMVSEEVLSKIRSLPNFISVTQLEM
jgi:D-3-phosphoglycerate dehydrogenase